MHTRLLRLLLLLAMLTGLVVACGDDDDNDAASAGDTTEEPASDDDASDEAASAGDFCDGLQAFNTAIFQTELDEESTPEDAEAAHETLDPLWSKVRDNAPEEQQAVIAELSATIDDLEQGDATAFNAEETSETYVVMVGEVIGDCVDEVVDVTAVDYAFQGAPTTFPANGGIRLENETEKDEAHEFIIFKKKEGETRSAQEILNDPASQEEGPGEFSGAVFASPGATGGGFLDLSGGDYVAVCFIPVGGGEDGPPHFTEGMFTEFSVE